MSNQESDAIVFFGASGDLAYKQIFPSLLRLVRDEGINVPIVGVAKSAWTIDDLRNRAKASLDEHGGADPESFQKLASLLRYVDGDYNDKATFVQLRKELGDYILLFSTDQWMRLIPQSWDIIPNAVSTAIQYASLDFPPRSGWLQYNGLPNDSLFYDRICSGSAGHPHRAPYVSGGRGAVQNRDRLFEPADGPNGSSRLSKAVGDSICWFATTWPLSCRA